MTKGSKFVIIPNIQKVPSLPNTRLKLPGYDYSKPPFTKIKDAESLKIKSLPCPDPDLSDYYYKPLTIVKILKSICSIFHKNKPKNIKKVLNK